MNIHSLFTGILLAVVAMMAYDQYPKVFQKETYSKQTVSKVSEKISKKTAPILKQIQPKIAEAKAETLEAVSSVKQKIKKETYSLKQSATQPVVTYNKRESKNKISLVEN